MTMPKGWRPVASLADLRDVPAEVMAEGRIVHFVWVGSDAPKNVEARLEDWSRLNPTAEVLLWGERALRELLSGATVPEWRSLIEQAQNPAAVSDVARFALLSEFGGMYMDADMEPVRPVSNLFEYKSGFVGRESRWLLNAGAIGLPRGSVYAHAALSAMAVVADGGTLTNYMSGPPLVTELSKAWAGRPGAPHVLDSWAFYPVNPFRFPARGSVSVPPYAVHLYAHSWSTGGEMSRARRLVRLSQPLTPKDIAVGARRQTQLALREIIRSGLPELSQPSNA